MVQSIFCTTAFAAALSLTPCLSVAQEVFGTLTASLDGIQRSWFLTAHEGESQSFGLTVSIANLQSFSMWGQPSAYDVQTMQDSLLLSFDVMSVGDQVIPLNMSVTYLENGWASGWVSDDPENIVFALTTLKKSDAGVLIEGSFDTVASYGEPLSHGATDASRTMLINGSFHATLPPGLLNTQ